MVVCVASFFLILEAAITANSSKEIKGSALLILLRDRQHLGLSHKNCSCKAKGDDLTQKR